MKKYIVSMLFLALSVSLASCGQGNNAQGTDTLSGIDSVYHTSMESGPDMSNTEEKAIEKTADGGGSDSGKEEGDSVEEEEVLLSDKILKAGDTMQVLYPTNEGTLSQGLEITLHEAKMFGSPEEAGLDRAQMEESTENYDVSGEPEWCDINEGKVLVCDMTVKNVNEDSDGEQHISEIMIAYADPETQKVTIVSCAPAYLSASSSKAGASDYYHYQVSKGESKDIRVAWLIQEGYEARNLYLCVTYDVRDTKERQYFTMNGQE